MRLDIPTNLCQLLSGPITCQRDDQPLMPEHHETEQEQGAALEAALDALCEPITPGEQARLTELLSHTYQGA